MDQGLSDLKGEFVAIGGCTKVDDEISSPILSHLRMTAKKEPAKKKVITVIIVRIGFQTVPLALDTTGILELSNFLTLGLYLNLLGVRERAAKRRIRLGTAIFIRPDPSKIPLHV